MLRPRLSPERSCVCCRSRRRLGRLRARPASHCNLDRVVFRYQNERRSRLLAASSYCARASTCSESCLSGLSPAPGPIRTARNALSAVGRSGHGLRAFPWVRFRFQSGVQGRGPLGLQYVDTSRPLRARSSHPPTAWRTGHIRLSAALPVRSGTVGRRHNGPFRRFGYFP
jgi:hypothetical protein